MKITDISIEKFLRCDARQTYDLVLCVHCDDQITQFRCVVNDDELTTDHDFETVLTAKILHQINQLPEIRSGREKVEISSDLAIRVKPAA
jgi:hypothetical protein